ncbi:hypothetical protein BT63DRAFT_328476 [Microthyrium microscopicum]|uniref:Protein kinase domain-containing protein n=1 Tax=Microthyrium microscopicum TaxID=703497 RepID=A0A6A6U6J9_9PEZI|nr:hypothetical protein BT63DRAFT_328476 [Microthyrium microscopicum]
MDFDSRSIQWYSATAPTLILPSEDTKLAYRAEEFPYRFLSPEPLGEGSFGRVYEVLDCYNKGFVAKFGNLPHAQEGEIHVMAMLRESFQGHPAYKHFSTFYGWARWPNGPALSTRFTSSINTGPVMDKYDGDLFQWQWEAPDKGSLMDRELQLWNIAYQLTVALQAIHDGPGTEADWRSIDHCDVHVQNVFFKMTDSSRFPLIVLADWGLAQYRWAENRPSIVQAKYKIPQRQEHMAEPDIDAIQLGNLLRQLIHAEIGSDAEGKRLLLRRRRSSGECGYTGVDALKRLHNLLTGEPDSYWRDGLDAVFSVNMSICRSNSSTAMELDTNFSDTSSSRSKRSDTMELDPTVVISATAALEWIRGEWRDIMPRCYGYSDEALELQRLILGIDEY